MMKLLKMLILCGVATGLTVNVNAMTHMTQDPGQNIVNALANAAQGTSDLYGKYQIALADQNQLYLSQDQRRSYINISQSAYKKDLEGMNIVLGELESMLGLINPNITVIFDGLDNQSLLNLLVQIGANELIKKLVDLGAVVTIEDVSYAHAIPIKGVECYGISDKTRREIYYFLLNKLPEDVKKEFLSRPVQESATINGETDDDDDEIT